MTDTPEDYSIDPADQHIADELINADPVYDVPSPSTITGHLRLPAETPLTTFRPDIADEIRRKVEAAPAHSRADVQRRLVKEALYQHVMDARVKTGLGPNASPYHREVFVIEREVRVCLNELADITRKVGEVSRHETVIDPVTGDAAAVPVLRYQGHQLKQLLERQSYLMGLVDALEGPEGERRKAAALKEAVTERKRSLAALEERAEAKQMAQDMLRKERVESQARAHANFIRARVS